jgi:hypothetical protein
MGKNKKIVCTCGKEVGKEIFIGFDKWGFESYREILNGNEARVEYDGVIIDFKDQTKIICKECYKIQNSRFKAF